MAEVICRRHAIGHCNSWLKGPSAAKKFDPGALEFAMFLSTGLRAHNLGGFPIAGSGFASRELQLGMMILIADERDPT